MLVPWWSSHRYLRIAVKERRNPNVEIMGSIKEEGRGYLAFIRAKARAKVQEESALGALWGGQRSPAYWRKLQWSLGGEKQRAPWGLRHSLRCHQGYLLGTYYVLESAGGSTCHSLPFYKTDSILKPLNDLPRLMLGLSC